MFPGVIKHYGNQAQSVAPLRRWLDAVVVQPDGCLTWGRALTSVGYGKLLVDGAQTFAHRFAYTTFVGPIADGLEIDHLCRNRACCNPRHLEAVTRRENQLRGMGVGGLAARRTHCVNGHEFTPENTYLRKDSQNPNRQCRTCQADRVKARRSAKTATAGTSFAPADCPLTHLDCCPTCTPSGAA